MLLELAHDCRTVLESCASIIEGVESSCEMDEGASDCFFEATILDSGYIPDGGDGGGCRYLAPLSEYVCCVDIIGEESYKYVVEANE